MSVPAAGSTHFPTGFPCKLRMANYSCACMLACGCAPDTTLRMPATGLGGVLSLLLSALAIFASMVSLGTLCAAAMASFLAGAWQEEAC